MSEIRLLSEQDVRNFLDIDTMIDALAQGFIALTEGSVVAPPRNGVEVPHGFTLDQAIAHHRDNVLRQLLDALRSLPATPVRQRLIDELAGIYFKGEATQERSEAS